MTIDKVLSAKEYEQLRTWTKLDDWAAAMGTVSIADKLKNFYDENKDLLEDAKKLAEQEQELLDMLERMEAEAQKGMSEEQIEEMLDELEEAAQGMSDAAGSMEESVQANSHNLRRAVAEGIEEALDEAESNMEMASGFGTDPGQWQRMDPRVRMAMASRLSNSRTLKQIGKMIGRMKRLAVGQWRRRVIHGVDEVYDVTVGRNLERILPSELLTLADVDTEDIFYAKYLEGSLLEYELRGTEKVAQGPIIALLDNSGSMRGEREIWGKAVALSLLQIAKEEKRDFYGIHFGSSYEMHEWYFKGGIVELEDVLDYAEHFFGGGTDFMTPLSRAIEIMDEYFMESGSSKADIVLITDGECAVSPSWMTMFFDAKEKLTFRMYGILIGSNSAVLNKLSDEIYTTQDLLNGDEVKGMFTRL
ncbi:hypothetical protein IH601_08875 [Candidatus Bipolaricaulota bacterium]|nr:hypothetical protein [Candidatus Bipolaricaulota bacterium]